MDYKKEYVNASYEYHQDIEIDSTLIGFEGIRLQGKKLSKFQDEQITFNTDINQRLGSLEAEKMAIYQRLTRLEERKNMSRNPEVVLPLQCGRLQEYLTNLRGPSGTITV